MPRLRRHLKVTEVSFVKHPANPAAMIALHKSEDGTMPELEDIIKSGGAGFTRADIAEAMEKAAQQWAEDHGIDLKLTTAQAYSKWLDTPAGRTAYAIQKNMRGPSVRPPEPPAAYVPSKAEVEINRQAEALRRGTPLTMEKAISDVLLDRPDLYRQHREEMKKRHAEAANN